MTFLEFIQSIPNEEVEEIGRALNRTNGKDEIISMTVNMTSDLRELERQFKAMLIRMYVDGLSPVRISHLIARSFNELTLLIAEYEYENERKRS
jgi:hypothetical protein